MISMVKERASIIVFSLTISLEQLALVIRGRLNKDAKVICLSTHLLFDKEREYVSLLAGREVICHSFYEFITQDEMEYCDVESDRIILRKYGTREGRLGDYYNKIKQLKNEIIHMNVGLRYDLEEKILLADDLGIDRNVWINNGFISDVCVPIKSDSGRNHIREIAGAIKSIYDNAHIMYLLNDGDNNYIFCGNIERIQQYLDSSKYILKRLSSGESRYLNILVLFANMSRGASRARKLFRLIFEIMLLIYRSTRIHHIPDIMTPMHEDSDAFGYLASRLNVKMIQLQDGFLPGYYPSAYLKYRVWVTLFYIWNRISKNIFDNHSLACEVWDCYKNIRLPLITSAPRQVRKIVFLTSGAGDWTALKNRSDEDLAFLAFVDSARENPGITYLYRPHPLWVYPEHQGVNSIQRLMAYAEKIHLPNLSVSEGALKEGNIVAKRRQLSFAPTSINEDIDSSDVILGDHSQALVTAAQRGKIIASVSVANRKEFFSDYTRLGFPILRSAKDITNLIKNVETSTEYITRYNGAVKLYNSNYS